MNIPTYVADQSTKTGSVGPDATPNDFGAAIGQGMEQFGRGMETGARGVTRAVRIYENAKAYTQHLDDSRWASNNFEQEKRNFAEFASKPENNTAENFAGMVQDYFKGRIDSIKDTDAPSKDASRMLSDNLNSYYSSQYDRALVTSVRNKITNSVTDTGNQISNAVAGYRAAAQIPGSDGVSQLVDSIAHIGANIEGNFRKFSPDIADGLQKNLITQSVLATMGDHPEAARSILDSTDSVDEQTRHTLNREIDQASNSRNLAERESFNNVRKDLFSNMENGKIGEKIPISIYEQYHPVAQAHALKMQDDAYVDTLNKSNGILRDIAPMNQETQLRKLSDLRGSMNGKMDEDVYNFVASKTLESLKLQQHNPVGWLQKNNPYVSSLLTSAAAAPQDEQPGMLKQLNQTIKKFQGVPPAGTPDKEKPYYLGHTLEDSQHVMDSDTATSTAKDLNQSTPQEFIGKMTQLFGRYPGDEVNAFNDLVTMPKNQDALRQEYQFAWQNKDASWLPTYLSSVSQAGKMGVAESVSKDLTKRIDTDPTWMKFKSTMLGGNFVGGNQIDGFNSGIQHFSEALVAQGVSPSKAVSRATDMLITSTLGLPKVNGRPMMILKERGPGLPPRTDAEVKQLGYMLESSLDVLDPKEIDPRQFPVLGTQGPSDSAKMKLLRDTISANAFFKSGPDGQSASLYMTNNDGTPFPVRDKSGNQMVIHYHDLENSPIMNLSLRPQPDVPPATEEDGWTFSPEQQKKWESTMKIENFTGMTRGGNRTNWPTADFWKHEK